MQKRDAEDGCFSHAKNTDSLYRVGIIVHIYNGRKLSEHTFLHDTPYAGHTAVTGPQTHRVALLVAQRKF